jgi:hypothetical protein
MSSLTRTRTRKKSLSISSKNSLIQTLLSDCKFGIEFETCFCFIDKPDAVGSGDDALTLLLKKLGKDKNVQ